ncbi:MAG: NfeD family protein [Proteobacteria bacterium]|nr:NfeD family protein [Pseudomonadota bacterium]
MNGLIDIYQAHALWAWLALGGALGVIELMTGSGWLLWPAATAAVVAVLAAYAGLSPGQAVLVYALITISAVLLARRYLPHRLLVHAGHDINDNVGRLVGHRGRAVTAFHSHAGRVFIDGKEWAAELEGADVLEAGSPVEVTGVAGAHLRVRSA